MAEMPACVGRKALCWWPILVNRSEENDLVEVIHSVTLSVDDTLQDDRNTRSIKRWCQLEVDFSVMEISRSIIWSRTPFFVRSDHKQH